MSSTLTPNLAQLFRSTPLNRALTCPTRFVPTCRPTLGLRVLSPSSIRTYDSPLNPQGVSREFEPLLDRGALEQALAVEDPVAVPSFYLDPPGCG